MDIKKKNDIAMYTLGGIILAALLLQLCASGAWYIICTPLLAAAASAMVLVALYRFVLMRDIRTAIASFVVPIVLGFATPLWAVFFLLFSLMPAKAYAESELANAVFIPIVLVLCITVIPVIGLVLSVLAMIKGISHLRAAMDTESKLISELPMLLAVVGSGITIGTCAFLAFAKLTVI